MAYILPNGKMVQLQVMFTDAGGNPAKVDGEIAWATADPNIAWVEVAAGNDHLATLHAGVELGSTQVHATADADLDEGEDRQIVVMFDVDVVAGEAVIGVISPGGEQFDDPDAGDGPPDAA